MTSDKDLLEQSADALTEKSEECIELAHAQRMTADKQHEIAHKLETLGITLADDAAEVRDQIETKSAVPLAPVT